MGHLSHGAMPAPAFEDDSDSATEDEAPLPKAAAPAAPSEPSDKAKRKPKVVELDQSDSDTELSDAAPRPKQAVMSLTLAFHVK